MFDHTWNLHTNGKYELLAGAADCCVRLKPLPCSKRDNPAGQGYLWQAGRLAGYADTVDAAKGWVEAIVETKAIPAKERWVNLSYLTTS